MNQKDETLCDLLLEMDTCFTKRGHDSLDGYTIARDLITGYVVGFKTMHRDCPVRERTGLAYDEWYEKSSSMCQIFIFISKLQIILIY